ncbi:MAG TPA: SIS domain-containing protein [Patescibacteria group bacterium]
MFKSALDDLREFKNHDKNGVYDSILKLSHQFESSWHEAKFVNLSFDPEKIKNIVYVGMGASNLSGKIIQSLSPLLLTVPFEVVSNYRLSNYVGKNSLVILSSYSGNTQEVISCGMDAAKRAANVICITTGGQLEIMAREKHWTIIKLNEKFNVCKEPRMGLFLSLGASLCLMNRLNPSTDQYFDLKSLLQTIEKGVDSGNRIRDTKTNPGKSLASKYLHQGLILIAANHLSGVADSAKNYFNESAKTFSTSFQIPDMNHHLLDGLIYPSQLKDDLKFIILNSDLYPLAIQKRIKITQEVLLRQKYQVTIIKPESENLIGQVLESLVFFIWVSYYLSIANKVDPGTNVWVDYFKKHL